MNSGKTIFSQLKEFLSPYEFRQFVQRYDRGYIEFGRLDAIHQAAA